ncbi:hypothetical protein Golax_023989 [Gossypium laxum]|uniref:Uncharacterized protein n=1 Tax=Gossypium laxum TaxID=34288 RepID=A0A7J8ZAP9_9ROSI|nr:hypothetical protein [Gossypium laxum]
MLINLNNKIGLVQVLMQRQVRLAMDPMVWFNPN